MTWRFDRWFTRTSPRDFLGSSSCWLARGIRGVFTFALVMVVGACPRAALRAQDLAPRAYIITPIHSNAVVLTYSYFNGGILFNDVLPITNATATLHVPIFSYYHSLSFFGRSANVTASLPYGVGHFHGQFIDNETKLYRSGLLDSVFRFSMNLKGGPAMSAAEMQKWQQTTIVGLSLTVVAPTGQYDPTKLVNNGSNRWAFKPELGYSRRHGRWVFDGYGGVWLFTPNAEFFSHNAIVPGLQAQSQKPICSFEGHLSYDLKRRLWFSFDSNFWFGGRTSLNSIENLKTFEANSRLGATASIPLNKRHSLKFSYSDGIYIRYGGNYQNLSVAWQYSWLGKPN
jgi:hypothetical protein